MKFPDKLWKIVNTCISGAIGWGIDGDRIFVDYDKFALEFLGNNYGGFKTKNVVSFVRQLNLYGFRKCSRYRDVHEFRHPYFMRGRKDMLKFMKRKLGGYTKKHASFENIEKSEMEVKTEEVKDEIQIPLKNESTNISQSHASYYNILWHQWQYYNVLYSEWLQKNPYFPTNEPNDDTNLSPISIKTEADDESSPIKQQSLNLGNLGRNIVFVPVPAQYVPGPLQPQFQHPGFAFPLATSHGMSLQRDLKSNSTQE